MSTPLIVAHSGFAGTPPNSLISVEAAGSAGVDAVEFDLQCSADGTPIPMHDGVVVSADGEHHRVASVPGESIFRGILSVPGRKEPPPTLAEIIDACRSNDLLLNLDVKTPRVFPAVRAILSRFGFHHRTFVTGCGIRELLGADRPIPETSLLVNIEPPAETEIERHTRVQNLIGRVVALGAQGINVEHTRVDRDLVTAARERFLSVAVWTVDRTEDLDRVRALPVDAITSNVPIAMCRSTESSLSEA